MTGLAHYSRWLLILRDRGGKINQSTNQPISYTTT